MTTVVETECSDDEYNEFEEQVEGAKEDAKEVPEQFFEYIVCDQCNGMPREIISDRDTIFTANFWCHLMKRCGTAIRLSSARSQQTNGLAERTIATVEECLRNSITYKQDIFCPIGQKIFLLYFSLLIQYHWTFWQENLPSW